MAVPRPSPRPSPRKSGAKEKLSLAVRILPCLRDLHPRIGRHQPAFVGQRHQLEAHVDCARGTFSAAAMDARVEPALAAFLDDLLINLEDFRLVAIELGYEAIGEAEIGRADID